MHARPSGKPRCSGHARGVTRVPTVLIAALALASLVASCTSAELGQGGGSAGGGRNGGGRESLLYDGPQIEARSHPYGLKWNWQHVGDLEDALASVAGGATFYEFEWCGIEPEQGERNWSEVDDVVASAQRLGYDVYLKIRTGSCWVNSATDEGAGDKSKTPSRFPDDPEEYEGFVAAVVERYEPRGVAAYAIENEPNATNFWRGTPEEYVELVRLGAEAVHRAAKGEVSVLDGGISSIGYGVAIASALLEQGRDADAVAFYDSYYARRFASETFVFPRVAGVAELRDVLSGMPAQRAIDYIEATARAMRYVDAWQLHYYEPWQRLADVVGYIRSITSPVQTVEAWEVGIAWPGPSYDEDVAASETAELLGAGRALGIGRLIYLPAAWSPGSRGREIWRGLWEPDGTPRPAAEVYADAVSAAQAGN